LNPPVRHQRSVQLVKRPDRPSGSYLVIEDRVTTAGSYRYQLRFHLAPDCKPAHGHGRFVVRHPNGPELAVGAWLVDEKGGAAALPITVENGWVSPEYGRRVQSPVLVINDRGTGDRIFVTILAPVEGEAAADLERLAGVDVERNVQYAA
jgi:hypothetical protein